jgi:methenyltetrahydromethanopterin cyclohydrolase
VSTDGSGRDATTNAISVNALAAPLVTQLINGAARYRVGVTERAGSRIIDAGVAHTGGLEAGRLICEICMGGLGQVSLQATPWFNRWPWCVQVATSHPVLACLGSQYAGWSLSHKAERSFHALGSGPGRALAVKEKLFAELDYRDSAEQAVLVLETDKLPPDELVARIAADCGVQPNALTLILTPTGSLAGVVQIAGRVVEVALHKAHELGFPLDQVLDGLGSTPLPPPVGNGMTAMGRTNDTILFGGSVHLYVNADDDAAEQLANTLPSGTSRDYGKPFAEVFKDYEYDFFKVDGMLFSPAAVAVTAVESGRTYHAGELDEALLERSFSNG